MDLTMSNRDLSQEMSTLEEFLNSVVYESMTTPDTTWYNQPSYGMEWDIGKFQGGYVHGMH